VTALAAALPGIDVRAWPDTGEPAAVEYASLWGDAAGDMRRFANLKVLFSLGAGVEHILGNPLRPPDVPVVRLIDPAHRTGMIEYVLMRVLHYHRRMPEYAAQQAQGIWRERSQCAPGDRRVGIMGMGELGTGCAEILVRLGFDVAGWSRSPPTIVGVTGFAGRDALAAFLARTEILVNLLPLTPETVGILDAGTLAMLQKNACLINVGRGRHLVEGDLLAALDSGHLAGATLDVFCTEPLQKDHPFWTHPKVTVTPHIAAMTLLQSAVPAIAENVRRHRAGEPMVGVVDPARGY
jgi:glyoxylate/hydroxypyruvate reductase A